MADIISDVISNLTTSVNVDNLQSQEISSCNKASKIDDSPHLEPMDAISNLRIEAATSTINLKRDRLVAPCLALNCGNEFQQGDCFPLHNFTERILYSNFSATESMFSRNTNS